MLIFLDAIEPFEDGQDKNNLLRLAFLFLEIAADENIEELIGAAQFHVGLHHDRIPALHDRILNFVRVDRLLLVDPVCGNLRAEASAAASPCC